MRNAAIAAVIASLATSAVADRFGINEASDSPVSFWGSALWIVVLVVGYILFRGK